MRSTRRMPSARSRQIERVVLLPRRMLGRDVERGEIVEILLDMRPLGDGEPHLAKDRDDLVDGLADRVDAARHRRAAPAGSRRRARRRGGRARARREPSSASASSAAAISSLSGVERGAGARAAHRPDRARRDRASAPLTGRCRPSTATRICSSASGDAAAAISLQRLSLQLCPGRPSLPQLTKRGLTRAPSRLTRSCRGLNRTHPARKSATPLTLPRDRPGPHRSGARGFRRFAARMGRRGGHRKVHAAAGLFQRRLARGDERRRRPPARGSRGRTGPCGRARCRRASAPCMNCE